MKDPGRKTTPIEQMFREIVKRAMTPKERRILLRRRKKPRKRS
jgi:hypothetical protein